MDHAMNREKIFLDIYEDVDQKGRFGWEITNENGNIIDQKYDFSSYEDAEISGEVEIKLYIKPSVPKKEVY